jgi:hypothetical protein
VIINGSRGGYALLRVTLGTVSETRSSAFPTSVQKSAKSLETSARKIILHSLKAIPDPMNRPNDARGAGVYFDAFAELGDVLV